MKKKIWVFWISLFLALPSPPLWGKKTPPRALSDSLSPSERLEEVSKLIFRGDLVQAYEKIEPFSEVRLQTIAQKRAGFLRGYLALQQGNPQQALALFSKLHDYLEIRRILPYWKAKAERLAGEPRKAIQTLEEYCQGPCRVEVQAEKIEQTQTLERKIVQARSIPQRTKGSSSSKKWAKRHPRSFPKARRAFSPPLKKPKTLAVKTLRSIPQTPFRMVREYASALCESGEGKRAEDLFAELMEKDPNVLSRENSRLAAVECQFQLGNIEQGYSHLRAIYAEARGGIPQARLLRFLDHAHASFPKLPQRFSFEDRIARISALRFQDRWVEAASELKDLWPALSPSSQESLRREAAETYFKARFYPEAALHYEQLAENSGEKELLEKLASSYARSHQFEKAIQVHRRLLKEEREDNAERAYKIAFLLYDAGKLQEAIGAFEDFIQRFPKNPRATDALWLKTWSLYRLQQWKQTLEHFDLLEENPARKRSSAQIAYWRMRVLERSGNTSQAGQWRNWLSREGRNFYESWDKLLSREQKARCPTLSVSPQRLDPILERMFESRPLERARALRELLRLGLWEDFLEVYAPLRNQAGENWQEFGADLEQWIRYFAAMEQLPPALIRAVIKQESQFNARVRSPVGALGLMQLMPQTGYEIAHSLRLSAYSPEEIWDPLLNVRFGSHYLATLSRRFSKNVIHAIAGYNAGPEAVERWEKQRERKFCDEFIEEIPFRETNHYVKKVMRNYWEERE